eukprot:scaffold280972_cov26-Prasinocladus_malaysianus.AAC.1
MVNVNEREEVIKLMGAYHLPKLQTRVELMALVKTASDRIPRTCATAHSANKPGKYFEGVYIV